MRYQTRKKSYVTVFRYINVIRRSWMSNKYIQLLQNPETASPTGTRQVFFLLSVTIFTRFSTQWFAIQRSLFVYFPSMFALSECGQGSLLSELFFQFWCNVARRTRIGLTTVMDKTWSTHPINVIPIILLVGRYDLLRLTSFGNC